MSNSYRCLQIASFSFCKQRADIWHILKLLYWILIVPVNRLCICHTSAAGNRWIISCTDWGGEALCLWWTQAGGLIPPGLMLWNRDFSRAGGRVHTHGVTVLVRITESQRIIRWLNTDGRDKVLSELRNESAFGWSIVLVDSDVEWCEGPSIFSRFKDFIFFFFFILFPASVVWNSKSFECEPGV